MTMNTLRRGLLAAALLAATAAQAQNAVKVDKAWARPTVAGQAGGGGFLTIVGGGAADRLLSASAGISKGVELHKMEMDGNVMRMRAVDAIDVPAGGTVELKPGGYHVMLMDLKAPLPKDSQVDLTLVFKDAKGVEHKQNVKMPVNAAAPMDHSHMKH